MTELNVIITRGIPGSGKSTWARAWVAEDPTHRIRVNKDQIREMTSSSYHSGGTEKLVIAMEDALITEALRAGKSVVVDNTHLKAFHISRITNLVAPFDAKVEIKDFDVSVEECLANNEKRKYTVDYVPPNVIRQMGKQWEQVKKTPIGTNLGENFFVYKPNLELPKAAIFDLDGTLANNTSGRDFYDYSRVEEDEVHEAVAEVARATHAAGIANLMVSGRDDYCMPETYKWLTNGNIPFEEVFMRITGDTRKDAIVKLEIFQEKIANNYNVIFVVDDRPQVIRAWESIGLVVLKVGPLKEF